MDYTKDAEIKAEIARVTDLGNRLMTYRAALVKRLESLQAAKAEDVTALMVLATEMKAAAEIVKNAGVAAEK